MSRYKLVPVRAGLSVVNISIYLQSHVLCKGDLPVKTDTKTTEQSSHTICLDPVVKARNRGLTQMKLWNGS